MTRILKQVLKSLVEAHAKIFVHRDIKPSNIMLCDQLGEVDFIKVLDFGLAHHKLAAGDYKSKIGTALGTPQ